MKITTNDLEIIIRLCNGFCVLCINDCRSCNVAKIRKKIYSWQQLARNEKNIYKKLLKEVKK